MCNKAVDNYSYMLEFVREYYKTQEICNKVVNTHSSTKQFVPECCKTQKIKLLINLLLHFLYL